MELNQLTRTCSMLELGNITVEHDFKQQLQDILDREIISSCRKNTAIICNTNASWFTNFSERLTMYKAGFRKVASYTGWFGNKVYVLIKIVKNPYYIL